jgi:hypothetical protein
MVSWNDLFLEWLAIHGTHGTSFSFLSLAGDAQLKPYVTADPEIRVVDRAEETWFLIIATDGLWDVISNKEAVQVWPGSRHISNVHMLPRYCKCPRMSNQHQSMPRDA